MNVNTPLRALTVALVACLCACGVSRPPAERPSSASMATVGQTVLRNEAAPPSGTPTMPAPPAPPAPPRPVMMERQAVATSFAAQPLPAARVIWPMPMPADVDTARYTHRDSNPVQQVSEQPVSTFSIDVDTGAYTHVRRMLEAGQLPPADAVRAEEFINYFDYGYAPPVDRTQPFSVTTELAPAPWNADRQLLLIGIQAIACRQTGSPPPTWCSSSTPPARWMRRTSCRC